MKVIYSFWTQPFKNLRSQREFGGFIDKDSFLSCAIKSVNLIKYQFDYVELYTDIEGLKELESIIYLFDNVKTIKINGNDNLFALSKFEALKHQKEPFIHCDFDMFILSKIDFKSDIIAEKTEMFDFYSSIIFDYLNSGGKNKYIIDYYNKGLKSPYAYCCGILGFKDIEFKNFYLEEVFLLKSELETIYKNNLSIAHMVLLEQSLLSILSQYKNKMIYTIEDSVKYIHYIADDKKKYFKTELLNNINYEF